PVAGAFLTSRAGGTPALRYFHNTFWPRRRSNEMPADSMRWAASYSAWQNWHRAARLSSAQLVGSWSRCAVCSTTTLSRISGGRPPLRITCFHHTSFGQGSGPGIFLPWRLNHWPSGPAQQLLAPTSTLSPWGLAHHSQ